MSLLAAFFAQVAIITYRTYRGASSGVAGGGIAVPTQAPMNLPLPASYTAPIFVYGVLALVPGEGQRVAGMVGWGFVVATLLNLWPAQLIPTTLTPAEQATLGQVRNMAPAPAASTPTPGTGQPGACRTYPA